MKTNNNSVIRLTIDGTIYEEVEVRISNPDDSIIAFIEKMIEVFDLPHVDFACNPVGYCLAKGECEDEDDFECLDFEDDMGKQMRLIDYEITNNTHLHLISIPGSVGPVFYNKVNGLYLGYENFGFNTNFNLLKFHSIKIYFDSNSYFSFSSERFKGRMIGFICTIRYFRYKTDFVEEYTNIIKESYLYASEDELLTILNLKNQMEILSKSNYKLYDLSLGKLEGMYIAKNNISSSCLSVMEDIFMDDRVNIYILNKIENKLDFKKRLVKDIKNNNI